MTRTNLKHCSARMKRNNPMRRGDAKAKMIATLKEMGHKPLVRGGNGTGLTVAQEMLSKALGWETEVCVLTGKGRGSGYPNVYKLDIGNPSLKVGVEVDGNSHGILLRQEQDRKKSAFLSGLGWTVFRFTNAAVIADLGGCVQMVMSTILKLKERTPISPTAS